MLIYILGLLVAFGAGAWVLNARKLDKRAVSYLLSGGGAFIIAVIFHHIIPETFAELPNFAGTALFSGFAIQVFLDFFSKGLEHGHVHPAENGKISTIAFIALCLHAFIEGGPLSGLLTTGGSYPLLLAILLHKIPVAIALAGGMIASKTSRAKATVLLGIFLAFSPLGTLVQWSIGNYIDQEMYHTLMHTSLALTVGILLHVSTTILFESSDHHRMSATRMAIVLFGFILGFAF